MFCHIPKINLDENSINLPDKAGDFEKKIENNQNLTDEPESHLLDNEL